MSRVTCIPLHFLVVILVLGVAMPAPIWAQTPPEKPATSQPDPGKMKPLREAIDGLVKAVKEKSDVDLNHFGKEVGDKYLLGDKAMQDEAVDGLGKALKAKNVDVRTVVVESLSKTGGKASTLLIAELDAEAAKKSSTYMCKVISAIGTLKEEKSIPVLLKLLHHKDNDVIKQTVLAFNNYRDTKLEQRKQLFEDLMKIYAPIESAGTRSGAKTTDETRYRDLRSSFESTLTAITNKSGVEKAFNWDQWYKKEGKDAKAW